MRIVCNIDFTKTYEEVALDIFVLWLQCHKKETGFGCYAKSTSKDYAKDIELLTREFLKEGLINKPLQKMVYSELSPLMPILLDSIVLRDLDLKSNKKYSCALKRFLEFLKEKYIFLHLTPMVWPLKENDNISVLNSNLGGMLTNTLERLDEKDLKDVFTVLLFIIHMYNDIIKNDIDDEVLKDMINNIIDYPLFKDLTIETTVLFNIIKRILQYIKIFVIDEYELKVTIEEIAMMLAVNYNVDFIRILITLNDNIDDINSLLYKLGIIEEKRMFIDFYNFCNIIKGLKEKVSLYDEYYRFLDAFFEILKLYIVFDNFHKLIFQ